MNVRKFLDLWPILYSDQPKRKKGDENKEVDTKADTAKEEKDREDKRPGNKR